jgi:hypothetical protein
MKLLPMITVLQLKDIIVHKFFGITSRMMFIAGIKIESEFPDVYLDFIWQYGIPSALWRGNEKSEMSQRAVQFHQDLVMADQFTVPHSPWPKLAELNCVKYFKCSSIIR